MREKLIELLSKVSCNGNGETLGSCPDRKCGLCGEAANLSYCVIQNTANNLISNGVTIQKEGKLYWKPVGKGTWNLTCSACDSHLGCRENAKYCPECGAKFVKQEPILPKLPEEEAWEDSKT